MAPVSNFTEFVRGADEQRVDRGYRPRIASGVSHRRSRPRAASYYNNAERKNGRAARLIV
ncbi:Mobile element protein (plasmid) [Sinorhizobium fredii CCBAU 25509]|nr:Mobile element protein [Sinorhizobium fredii CCBAU 25509]